MTDRTHGETGLDASGPTSATPEGQPRARPPFSMRSFRDVRLPLLVFAPSVQDAAYRRQKELLDETAGGLTQREVVIVEVIGTDLASADGVTIPVSEAASLRSQWNAPGDVLTVVLVGKDGTEKLRANQPVSAGTLFALIDSMPMRQAGASDRPGD